MLLLLACIAPADPKTSDLDGDGATSDIDCDDENEGVFPDAAEVCNGIDDDCDGEADEDPTDAASWYYDGDADGYGVDDATTVACEPPDGYASDGGDCNDNDAEVHPAANETCDGLDEDCDDATDEDPVDPLAWYADVDGDGYGAGAPTHACEAPAGAVDNAGDCADGDASVHPGADEACDTVDSDCDGATDEPDSVDALVFYVDADDDGFGTGETTTACADGAGIAAVDGDCDDTLAAVNPTAAESCNGVDDDCDGAIDPLGTGTDTYFPDTDGDGYGSPIGATKACSQPDGYETDDADCDDADPDVHDDATEACNGHDDDCDGETDEAGATGESSWYLDDDGDGYGSTTSLLACDAPDGYIADASDCDDGDAATNPGASEYCGGGDEDCDGETDESDAVDIEVYCEDADGDGYGGDCDWFCDAPVGWIVDNRDCDDDNAAINPGEIDLCATAEDDDCSGSADDAVNAKTYYADLDGDGYGDEDSPTTACAQPADTSTNDRDCDDTLASVSPGDTEVCENGLDDDCDEDVEDCRVDDLRSFDIELEGDTYMLTEYPLVIDANHDGIGDLLSSSWASDTSSGDVMIWHGPVTSRTMDVVIDGEAAGDRLRTLSNAGDIDFDGFDDLLMGASYANGTGGITYLWTSVPTSGSVALADARFLGETGDYSGGASAGIGDTDGDGIPEVAIGRPSASPGGAAAIFSAVYTGDVTIADADVHLTGAEGYFGSEPVALGDTDGDGYDDAAFSAPLANGSLGQVYVFHGPIADGSTTADAAATIDGASADYWFGSRVDAGDVDGDGVTDLLGGSGYGYGLVPGPFAGSMAVDTDGMVPPELTSYGRIGGDSDADGVADVVLGYGSIPSGSDYPCMQLYYGGEDISLDAPGARGYCYNYSGTYSIGHSAYLGDVDDDGYADVVTGVQNSGTSGSFGWEFGLGIVLGSGG